MIITRRVSTLHILFIILLSPLFYFAPAQSNDELIILKIVLNTYDRGDFFVYINDEKDIYISTEDLKKIGFHKLPLSNIKNSEGYVSLTSLSPDVTFSFNEKESALLLTASPDLLETHTVDFTSKTYKNVVPLSSNSMYVNYQINYNITDESRFNSVAIPFETGLRVGPILSYSNFNYTKTAEGEKFTRLFTNFTTDSTKTLRRVILGDFTASSGTGIGENGILGGISISKNYSLSPYFIKVPRLQLSGILETPSEVDIYVNDTLVSSEFLPPGKFEFLNLPTHTSGGKTLMVIKDAYGREDRIEAPFILSANLLRPGINEYSYNLGFVRKNFGTKGMDYGDLSYMFFHRRGLTRYFTGGIRGEGTRNIWNVGPAINLLVSRFGQINSSFAVSSYNGKRGYGSVLHYSTSIWKFFLQLTYNTFSKGYSNLFKPPSTDSAHIAGVGTVGFSDQLLGSLSATINILRPHQGAERREGSISYSRFISRYFSLFINARRIETPFKEDMVLVGLNFFSGTSTTANVEYQHKEESEQFSINIQKSPQSDLGTTYRLRGVVNRFKNTKDQHFIDAGVRHLGTFGNVSLDYNRSGGINNYFFKYAGSISLLNSSFYISRPIFDSYAVVDVGNVKGVEVFFENRSVGKTGSDGAVVIPGITSYNPVRININPDDLPLEYSLPKTEEYILLPFKSGAVVKFSAIRLQSFEGTIALLKDGKKEIAEYGTIDIYVDKDRREIMTGQNGMFYFENIPPGKYDATLNHNDDACRFTLTLPDTGEIITDLGEVVCKMENLNLPPEKLFEKIWGEF